MLKTRPRHAQKLGLEWLTGVGIALLSVWLGWPSLGAADPGEARVSLAPVSPVVVVAEGTLTVDLYHAELESVLREIATRAAFDLRTSGQLGRVTAAFTGVSLEEGLRRLAPEHELMLVYRAPSGGAAPTLVEVRVFAGTRPNDSRSAAADLAEIRQLLRSGGGQAGAARLADLLGAPDATVRTRAAAALGRMGGMNAEAPLTAALSDQAAEVRVQAVGALGRIAGARAIPALQGLLLRDPDPGVRRAAARTLGMLRGAAATSALAAAAADPDASVRQEVSRALRRHGVAGP